MQVEEDRPPPPPPPPAKKPSIEFDSTRLGVCQSLQDQRNTELNGGSVLFMTEQHHISSDQNKVVEVKRQEPRCAPLSGFCLEIAKAPPHWNLCVELSVNYPDTIQHKVADTSIISGLSKPQRNETHTFSVRRIAEGSTLEPVMEYKDGSRVFELPSAHLKHIMVSSNQEKPEYYPGATFGPTSIEKSVRPTTTIHFVGLLAQRYRGRPYPVFVDTALL